MSLQTDGASFFGRSNRLRRSSSQSSFQTPFKLPSSTSYASSPSNIRNIFTTPNYEARLPASLPSSAPSSPRFTQPEFSNLPSFTSTPSSSFSLDEFCSVGEESDEGSDDEIKFPSFDDGLNFEAMRKSKQDLEPHKSAGSISSEIATPSASESSVATPSLHDFHDPQTTAGDDTAVKREPTKQVDYFSHNWNEEDIWSSWRYVVAKRKSFSNSLRLENASWRAWTKNKYRLKTVSPDSVDWYAHVPSALLNPFPNGYLTFYRRKDHDVTWLYGPFQSGSAKPLESDSASSAASQLSRSNSFSYKKPILKKRSLSEIMLQRSISSSTLMKQATDALRAQHSADRMPRRPSLKDRAASDFVVSSRSVSQRASRSTTGLPSGSTSGPQTPCTKRHIHFNNKVEQCIAINKCSDDYYCALSDGSSSDEDLLMMKSVSNGKTKPGYGRTPRNSFSSESKTIAMLPSTTLKYRGDTPEPVEPKSNKGAFRNAGITLSPSPSLETIKIRNSKTNFLLDDEDDDADLSWQPMASRRENEIQSEDPNYDSGDEESIGLRRTPSGMFMPVGDNENNDAFQPIGLLGKVVDTVNTAKDIVHVIWNVGWRR